VAIIKKSWRKRF